MGAGPLRPMSTGELLDRTFTLIRRQFLLFAGIMVIPQIFLLAAELTPSLAGVGSAVRNGLAFGIVVLVMYLIGAITSILAQAAAIFAVSEIQVGRTISVRQAYSRVRAKLWPLATSGMIYGLAVGVGALLLLIPGIWLALRGALVFQVATLENLKGGAALRRSIVLTKGSAGQIFLVWVFIVFIALVAAAIFQFPATVLLPAPWSVQVGALGGVIAGVLVGPVAAIALSLVYFDQRVRKEALDLQVMMAALDQPSPMPGSVPPPVPL